MTKKWNIWVDTGGTFTDIVAIDPSGTWHRNKVLSSSTLRGTIIRRISEKTYKIKESWKAPDQFINNYNIQLLDDQEPDNAGTVTDYQSTKGLITLGSALEIDPEKLPAPFEVSANEEAPILAARLITKTSLDKPLPPCTFRLATTRATNALLEQKGAGTLFITTEGFKDLLRIRYQQRPDLFSLQVNLPEPLYQLVIEIGERVDANGNIICSIDEQHVNEVLGSVSPTQFESVAVCFMNSYQNATNENIIYNLLAQHGFSYIIRSSALIPRSGIIPRAETTVINAYLAPIMERYIHRIEKELTESTLQILTSAGGLGTTESYRPKDSLLSGPAGGVVGAAAIGKAAGYENILSFDMGGTSTDMARYNGDYVYQHEHQVGNAHIAASALAIETVAAGGGSICSFDGFAQKVGPESAGADPGAACYGAGGPLTLSDVNLLLGRIHTSNFSIPVDRMASEKKLQEILNQIERSQQNTTDRTTALTGFLQIANERMAETMKKISMQKGFNPSEFALVAFGGAGGQHACAVADLLDISTILFPRDAGLLSARGLGYAVTEHIEEKEIQKPLQRITNNLNDLFHKLTEKTFHQLKMEGLPAEEITIRNRYISLRFQGQQHSLELDYSDECNLFKQFKVQYEQEFGHWIEGRTVEVESIRVIGSEVAKESTPDAAPGQQTDNAPNPDGTTECWFEGGFRTVPFYRTDNLQDGCTVTGPALILDPNSTLVVEKNWRLAAQSGGYFQLNKRQATTQSVQETRENHSSKLQSVELELFTNRLTSIAEEMGEMLRRTAISVNIKERLDFSCALLDADGNLIVNAPHIPVHLGALGLCVRRLKESVSIKPGDTFITNHPGFGGSHLPDVTVVTPIFTDNKSLIGFSASRAHHAELGGSKPGSMPPDATTLAEEGVVIPPVHIIKKGDSQWDTIVDLLTNGPYPTRALEENMADIRAAVAANHRGVIKLTELCTRFGTHEITHYMDALKQYAADKIKRTLKSLPDGTSTSVEYLDDGTKLEVTTVIDCETISFDFTGTAAVHPGNLNATPAIVQSVIMYVLRLLVEERLPLNEGLMEPVEIVLPTGLLNPEFSDDSSQSPAIVGGNTEISQRLVDLLLKPFGKMAASQGTMNNLLFGNDSFGYYETIGGGTGAGVDFDGADGVHHHMSNTRGTDPETLEKRYPVHIKSYSIREGSGGKGTHSGGDGITKKLVFDETVSLSVLTQQRNIGPYGLNRGEQGQPGKQYIIRKNGVREKLGSVDGAEIKPGDQLIIQTPGGGGFGERKK